MQAIVQLTYMARPLSFGECYHLLPCKLRQKRSRYRGLRWQRRQEAIKERWVDNVGQEVIIL